MASESENEKKREIIADVLADFRQYISNTNIPPEVAETIVCYIDRIEAAWKHEREEAEADALAVGGIVEAARHKPVGNAAAMRAVLETLLNLAYVVQDENSECGPKTSVPLQFIIDVAKFALSAPARNCDKFADAESARQAWLADAENWDEFGSPELELHEWLLAPAENGGAE